MASISYSGSGARARWTIAALLRRLQLFNSPRPIDRVAAADDVAATEVAHRGRRTRRYPRRRDFYIERAAMAREMFRL